MMYLCLDCLETFDEPKKRYEEQLEFFGHPCREVWSGCPSCGAPYVETYECDLCGEYIKGGYIETIYNEKICGCCYRSKNVIYDNY